jgi:hypothetical protein
MRILPVSAIFLASFLISNAAFAQKADFAHFDRDKNGRVTQGEISSQRDQEIIAAMDADKDGSVSPNEWLATGRGASFVDQGGVDDRGVARRWLEFKVVFFYFGDGEIVTSWHEGQAPLAIDANAASVESTKAMLNARFNSPPTTFPGSVRLEGVGQ